MSTPPVLSSAELSQNMVAGVRNHLEKLSERFFPGFILPGYMLGQPVTTINGADLAYVLAWLYKLGVSEIGGMPVAEAARRALLRIDGPCTEIFYSYRVAETLLAFGPAFEGNPLMEGFTEAERENLRVATDTTAMFNPVTKQIPGYPNNYWSVLARCEQRRQDLGILADSSILDYALERTQALLFANPTGFFDDSPELDGRFDIYTADTHLFCEPLWPRFDQERLRSNLLAHVRLLELAVQENGAAFSWGRSVGALSVCLTMELGGAALDLGMAADPARMLGLVDHAHRRFSADWLDSEDGLITSHRGRATEAYRGPYRQLQVTLDCLGKFLYTAKKLSTAPTVGPGYRPPELFPETDTYFSFVGDDPKPAGVWAFRNGQITFSLALTYGRNSDYTPSPRGVGLFENPVDSGLICALPRVMSQGQDFSPGGRPLLVEKLPAGLRVVYEGFPCSSDPAVTDLLPARREAIYRVERDALTVEEHWTFAVLPEALTWHLPECVGRPLHLEMKELPAGAHLSDAAVDGLFIWRSAWREAGRVHQVNFQPAQEVHFSYRVRPKVRVAVVGAEHDYIRLLYEGMPKDACILHSFFSRGLSTDPTVLEARLAGCDVLHLHWPEWSFDLPAHLGEEAKDALLLAALKCLGELPVRVIWTMHNRRPHSVMGAERGKTLYRAMAAIADGVIHHSQWGMDLIRGELPYKATALHTVAAHGHFGSVNRLSQTRAELEKHLGLPPCETRFGVIGRPQKEKQVEMIIRAFRAGAHEGQQLFVTAATAETLELGDGDPRVVIQPRTDWLSREQIAGQLHVCDAIVNAHSGDTYLTSGIPADAIGLGMAMLAPQWEFFLETLGDAAFYHDHTEAGLSSLFASLSPEAIAVGKTRMAALQEATAWTKSATTTLALLRSVPRKTA